MPDEITDVQVDGAPIQPDIAEGATAEPTPDKTYTQVEYDALKQSLTEEWKTKSDETFKKRWGKEMAKFEEETGLNRSFLKSFKPLAQQYGVTPQYLVETILHNLKQTPQGESPQVTLPPEIEEILQERRAEKEQKSVDEVKSLYKKDFGSDLDDDDLETLKEMAEEEKVHLKAAYTMAIHERWADQLSKAKEAQVLKNLADKKKGNTVPGNAPKVTPTKQYGSIREGLSAIADEIGLT